MPCFVQHRAKLHTAVLAVPASGRVLSLSKGQPWHPFPFFWFFSRATRSLTGAMVRRQLDLTSILCKQFRYAK